MPAIMELGSSCAAEFTVSLAPMTRVKSVSVGQTFMKRMSFVFFKNKFTSNSRKLLPSLIIGCVIPSLNKKNHAFHAVGPVARPTVLPHRCHDNSAQVLVRHSFP